MTVSEGGTLSLWNSNTGELRSKCQLSGLQEETPTSSVLIQKQGKMIVGFSGGSLSTVHISVFNLLIIFLVFAFNIQRFTEPDNRSGNQQVLLLYSE